MSFHPLDPLLDAVGFDNKASFENKTVVPFVDSYYTDIDHSDDDSQPGPGHAVPIFPTHMISWGANSRDGDGDIPTQVPLQAKPALILLSQQQQRTHNPWGQLLQAAKAGSKGAHHPHRPGPQRRSAVAAAKAEAAASRAAALVAIATTAAASASVAVDEDDDDDAKEARDTSQPDYEVGDTTVDGDGVAWRVRSVDGAAGDKVTWIAIKQKPKEWLPGQDKAADATSPTLTPRRRAKKKKKKAVASAVVGKKAVKTTKHGSPGGPGGARQAPARGRFACKVCKKSLKMRKHLTEHMKRAHSPKVRCTMCNMEFTNHGNDHPKVRFTMCNMDSTMVMTHPPGFGTPSLFTTLCSRQHQAAQPPRPQGQVQWRFGGARPHRLVVAEDAPAPSSVRFRVHHSAFNIR